MVHIIFSSLQEIKLNVLLAAVGNISETDVSLAAVSKSLIVGFNVRIPTQIVDLAKQRSVPIRSYRIIYELMDDLSKHVSEMLDPRVEELISGVAEIQKLFEIKKKKEKVPLSNFFSPASFPPPLFARLY